MLCEMSVKIASSREQMDDTTVSSTLETKGTEMMAPSGEDVEQ